MARPGVKIAISGTPGVGKTSLAKLLTNRGEDVQDLKELAACHGANLGLDAEDDSDVIDLDALKPHVKDGFIDSHMAHLLDVDVVWLIRCHPSALEGRLEARGYKPAKVRENLEAEAMDLILQEALDSGTWVVQRDGTNRTPDQLLSAFDETQPASLNSHDIEPVDWSDWLLENHGP